MGKQLLAGLPWFLGGLIVGGVMLYGVIRALGLILTMLT